MLGPGEIEVLTNGSDFAVIDNDNIDVLKGLATILEPTGEGSEWSIVRETEAPPPNDYRPVSGRDASAAKIAWKNYLREHQNDEIRVERIFEIDLNRALFLEGNVEVWHRKTRNYKRRT